MKDEIVFSLVRPEALSIKVRLTMKGEQREVAAMIFTAMETNPAVQFLLLKTVAGFCAVNNISMADIEKNFNLKP